MLKIKALVPYLRIQTNMELEDEQRTDLAGNASKLVAELLEKPEAYVQVQVQDGEELIFGGSSAPNAFIELRSLGLPDDLNTLSKQISATIEQQLEIAPDRIFINFFDLPRSQWAWNGKTFG